MVRTYVCTVRRSVSGCIVKKIAGILRPLRNVAIYNHTVSADGDAHVCVQSTGGAPS